MRRSLFVFILSVLASVHALCQSNDYAAIVWDGLRALEQDSFSKAESLFLKAIDSKPLDKASAVLYQYVGQIRVRQNRYTEAMEAFKAGLNISPTSQDILLDKASLNIQIGEAARAMDDLNDILTLNPNHAEALFFRAYLYAEQHLIRYHLTKHNQYHFLYKGLLTSSLATLIFT